MVCRACGNSLTYANFQGFPLCKRCYAIAEQLLPLLTALDNLKYFSNYIASGDFKERVDALIRDLQVLIEDFAKTSDREADDPVVNALNRVIEGAKRETLNMMKSILNMVDLEPEVKAKTEELIRQYVEITDGNTYGKSVKSLVAGLAYMACISLGKKVKQRAIAEKFGITDVTLRNILKKPLGKVFGEVVKDES